MTPKLIMYYSHVEGLHTSHSLRIRLTLRLAQQQRDAAGTIKFSIFLISITTESFGDD